MLKKELKRFLVLLLVSVVYIAPFSMKVHAFTESDVCKSGAILTTFEIRYIPHGDFGNLTISHMNEALYQWNKLLPIALLGREPTKRHYDSDYRNPIRDQKSKVYRVPWPDDKDVIAENYIDAPQGVIKESDININMACSWANSAQIGKYDFWTVFLHEAGHTVGLGDRTSAKYPSIMYHAIAMNTEIRTPRDVDIYSVEQIY